MLIKEFDSSFYQTLCEWWKKHNHAIIPEKSLPYGVVIINNNIPVCVSFLYCMDNCELSQISWTTSNPNSGLKERYNGINLAIDALLIKAMQLNKKHIISFSNSSGLVKLFKKKGLTENSNHTLLIGSF